MKLFVEPMQASSAGLTATRTAGELSHYRRQIIQRVLHLYGFNYTNLEPDVT